jgi:hypothetical protein
MKRPKPKLRARAKAKPPTIREVLGRIESRCLRLESALDTLRNREVASLRSDTASKFQLIEKQDREASTRIDDQLATLRNQVENLRYKFDGGGLQQQINEAQTSMHHIAMVAAGKALELMRLELERMGVKL